MLNTNKKNTIAINKKKKKNPLIIHVVEGCD